MISMLTLLIFLLLTSQSGRQIIFMNFVIFRAAPTTVSGMDGI